MAHIKNANVRENKFKIIFLLFLFSLLIPHHPYFVFSVIFAFSSAEAFVEYVLPDLETDFAFDVIKNNFIKFILCVTFLSNYYLFKYHFVTSLILSICMSSTTKELMKIF